MAKMVVVLKWNEEKLGKGWMNEDNLNLCLFSPEHSKPTLLKVTVIATEEQEIVADPCEWIEEPL